MSTHHYSIRCHPLGWLFPQDHANILREVLIDRYANMEVEPLICWNFTTVDYVEFLQSPGDWFNAAVLTAGGIGTYLDCWTVEKSFVDCMQMFVDNYPYNQGYLETTQIQNQQNMYPPSSSQTMSFTMLLFFNWWYMMFFVTDKAHLAALDSAGCWF